MNSGAWRTTSGFKAQLAERPVGSASPNRRATGDGTVESLSYGVGPSRFDLAVDTTRTIAAGGSLTVDLFGGVDLVTVFNGPATFRTVKSCTIAVESGGDTGGVRIGGAGSNAWQANFGDVSDTWDVFPSGPPFQIGKPDGITVSGTSKNLLLTNRGAVAVTVSIRIAGSAAATGVVTGVPGMPLYA